MIFALIALAQMHGLLLQAQTLPISPLPWFSITMVVALVVIVIAAAIYMLGPVLHSSAIQQWSRFQIYEAVLSIALIVLFLGVVQILFLNPQSGFSAAGLVPNGCTGATTIYTLSACDLGQFNAATYTVAGYMWGFAVVKALIPDSSFSIQPTPQEGDNLEINFNIPNILDAQNTKIINYLLEAILIALLLSQLQLILLSSSLLLLSLFFSIGLIARVFGISRSFGGAMIAFGIGLGIIYPLLIAITYGYIDVSANTACLTTIIPSTGCASSVLSGAASSISASGTVSSASTFASSFATVMVSPFSSLTTVGSLISSGAGISTGIIQTFAGAIAYVFKEVGYILAGLTLIPIINILIVDVFIIDFSRAVGEQMSFSMLFQGLV